MPRSSSFLEYYPTCPSCSRHAIGLETVTRFPLGLRLEMAEDAGGVAVTELLAGLGLRVYPSESGVAEFVVDGAHAFYRE